MHQRGVCGEGGRLLLHGRIDNHLGEVRWSRGTRSRRGRKALLQERVRLLLAHALTPARQRRALERKLVAKELLAAEELIIRIIQPALAQDFIGEIVRVLQDRQARHEPCGKRRLTRPVRINGAEALLQKIPVDRARKFHERAIHIGDLVEPCLEQIILPAVPPLPRSHRITLRCIATAKRITPKAPDQFARKTIHSAKKPANPMPRIGQNHVPIQRLVETSRATKDGADSVARPDHQRPVRFQPSRLAPS